MAVSKRTVRRKIAIQFDTEGAFTGAFQLGERQLVEDGVVLAERGLQPQFMTLAEVKTLVASL